MPLADRLRQSFSSRNSADDESGFLEQVSSASTLSWSTRIKGFIACFVVGVLLSVLGSVTLFFQQYTVFAILYSLGTLTSLASTMFLMGPLKQIKRMIEPTRLICTIILLVCIVLTILSGVLWKNGGLAILFCILQFLALAWYSISYIPFASNERLWKIIRDAYQESFPMFMACLFILLYFSNSLFVHYAPLVSNLIQLLVITCNGELDNLPSDLDFRY